MDLKNFIGSRLQTGGWEKTRELSLGEAPTDPEFRGLALDFKTKLVGLIRGHLDRGVIALDEIAR